MRIIYFGENKRSKNNGQAALALVFLVGGTVILVGATLAFLVFNFINSTYGFQAANRALGAAMGGANDVLRRLAMDRNLNFNNATVACEQDFLVDGIRVRVQILRFDSVNCEGSNKPSSSDYNKIAVNVEASVLGRKRRVEMVVSVDHITGEIGVISIRQFVGVEGGGGVE